MKSAVFAACLLLLAVRAHAEVKQAAADGFLVSISAPLAVTPARVYAALAQPARWWSGEHTWSGKATNLRLDATAGGCFCERWKGGSAEHGRVIMAMPDQLLRLDAALGPLQEFALKGTLSFWIRVGDDGATRLDVEYRVNGASASGLDQFAPAVDQVLDTQVARLKRYLETGNPEPPPPAPAVDDASSRAAILKAWEKDATNAQREKPPAPGKPAADPSRR